MTDNATPDPTNAGAGSAATGQPAAIEGISPVPLQPVPSSAAPAASGEPDGATSTPAVPSPPAGNAMAPAEHSSDPQPEDSHTPYTDVDPQPLVPKLRWESPSAMVKEIDNHVRQSHGLAADTSLLKEIAAFVRQVSHVDDSAS